MRNKKEVVQPNKLRKKKGRRAGCNCGTGRRRKKK